MSANQIIIQALRRERDAARNEVRERLKEVWPSKDTYNIQKPSDVIVHARYTIQTLQSALDHYNEVCNTLQIEEGKNANRT